VTYRCILFVVLGDSPGFTIGWEDLGYMAFYDIIYEDDYFNEDD
jgi:hypothetical protein